jgi:hypothetical protein
MKLSSKLKNNKNNGTSLRRLVTFWLEFDSFEVKYDVQSSFMLKREGVVGGSYSQ